MMCVFIIMKKLNMNVGDFNLLFRDWFPVPTLLFFKCREKLPKFTKIILDFLPSQKYNKVKVKRQVKMMTEQKKMGRPKAEKPKSHQLTIRFDDDEYKIVTEYCNTNNLNASTWIREFIVGYLTKK